MTFCVYSPTDPSGLFPFATPGACREGWVSFQGSCYLLSVAAVTWSQAEEKCRTHGGHLVVLNSVEELVRFSLRQFGSMYCKCVKWLKSNMLLLFLFWGLHFENSWNPAQLLDRTCGARTWGTLELGGWNRLQLNSNVSQISCCTKRRHHREIFGLWCLI